MSERFRGGQSGGGVQMIEREISYFFMTMLRTIYLRHIIESSLQSDDDVDGDYDNKAIKKQQAHQLIKRAVPCT